MKNKAASIILILSMILSVIPSAFADGEFIEISSTEDFSKLAEICTLDTRSKNMTVNLKCDIDFSKTDFKPVPTFGGVFNGNGFTLSGIDFESKGSYVGVFRYLQQGGRITGLNVKASFKPQGAKSFVGGIVGECSGDVENCMFSGEIDGESVIGGIVGQNTQSGRVISCTCEGSVNGENSTGGIVGKNSGFIADCVNNAAVNTVYEEKKSSIEDIDTDVGSIVENYKSKEEQSGEESVLGHSDTGGIVGYTSGVVQGCRNNVNIGYKHVGYNVGGIAGRQSGYMLGCENYGFIQGRKDVGGIVGQAEPYIILNTSENMLRDLSKELDNLNSTVNRFITDSDELADTAKEYLDLISSFTNDALDNTENLLDGVSDFADDNLNEINAEVAILSNTLDKLSPVFKGLESGCENMINSVDLIVDALDEMDLYVPDLKDDIDDLTVALEYISQADNYIRKAASRFNRAEEALDDTLDFNGTTQVKQAAQDLSDAIKDIITARQTIKQALSDIENILKENPDGFEAIGLNVKKIIEIVSNIAENNKTMTESLKTIKSSLDTIVLNAELDLSQLKTASRNISYAVSYFGEAMYHITNGLDDLSIAVKNISNKLLDFGDDLSEDFDKTKDKLSRSFTSLSYATDDIRLSINELGNVVDELSNEEHMEFVKLDDDVRKSSENLFNSLSSISEKIDGLKGEISGKDISSKVSSVTNQFKLVMDLLVGEAEDLKEGSRSLEDIFVDVSDENIENVKQGKVQDCRNFGRVEADRNIGGAVGAVAIEYSKDPEDDIEKPDTLNFTYRSRAIIQSCVNNGVVVGKKDCSGGIVGFSEIGTVYKCENYADIESENGNYVGGIAGKSESSVRKSYAKSKVTGKRYVGGVVGRADTLAACCSISNVSGEENSGAICGDVENRELLYNNYYVDNGLGAVDGISYLKKAEPISFDELKNIVGLPSAFIGFRVRFLADGKEIGVQEIKYGESTERINYPKVPEKDGCFGKWKIPDAQTITENLDIECEYKNYITVLSSVEKNESGKLSLALADGEFTDDAQLHVTESSQIPPTNSGNVKVYDVALLHSDINDDVTLRLINEDKANVKVWTLENGKWINAESSKRGKYVKIKLASSNETVCIKYEKKGAGGLIVLCVSVFAAAAILAAVMIKKKKKRSR